MAYSTIPAAKSALITLLQARPDLTGVLIDWGIPQQEPTDSRERVYVDDAINVKRDWIALGQLRLDETYAIQVAVEVYREGSDRRACEERMWAIVAEVEQTAVLSLRLPVTQWEAPRPEMGDPKTFPWGEGWCSNVLLELACSARIQAA